MGNKGRLAESYSKLCICFRAVVLYQARRSVVHPQDDAANSIITICMAYMSLTKNTILMCSRLCMYITGDRRGFVALIAHRHYLRPVQLRFPPSVRGKLGTLCRASVELGRRKSDSAVSYENAPLYIIRLEFKSQSSKVPSRGEF